MIRAFLLAATACVAAAPVMAAEIRLFGTGAVMHSIQEIVPAFEKETGIKVEIFRSGGSEVLRRFHAPSQAVMVPTPRLPMVAPAVENETAARLVAETVRN